MLTSTCETLRQDSGIDKFGFSRLPGSVDNTNGAFSNTCFLFFYLLVVKSLVFPTDIRTVNYDDALDVRSKGCAGFLSETAKLLIWLDNLRATSEVLMDLILVK